MARPRGGYGGASYEALTLAWARSVGSLHKDCECGDGTRRGIGGRRAGKEPVGMTSEVWLIQRWKHHSLRPGTRRGPRVWKQGEGIRTGLCGEPPKESLRH